jgi:hypothetical protein
MMEASDQLHAPAALSRAKSPQHPLYRRLSGPQSRTRRCREEKNLAPSGRSLFIAFYDLQEAF